MKNITTFIRVFLRMARVYLFYPLMIGLFLWLFFKNAHWGYGLVVIILILTIDPIWRILARNIVREMGSKRGK